MKKVVYSVTKVGKMSNTKMSGVGYITDTDLIIACVSKNDKPYIRVFEDCIKDCHLIINTKDEYKGAYYEIREIEFENDKGSKDTREIEMNYYIWYKLAD